MSNSSSFFYSKAGVVIPMCTGILSAISSLTIMTVIYRSQVKFASIYNRIMFGVSFFDFIGSGSIALTLLPLPVDQPYPYPDWARGNTSTCEAQGFMVTLGTAATGIYICGLCTFYACLIIFQMSKKKMRMFVEPCIHISSWLIPLIACSVALNGELINPTPFVPWCTTVVYPYECAFNEEVECIRGEKEFNREIFYGVSLAIGLILISILGLSLVTIIIGTCKGGRVRLLFQQTEMPNHDSWKKKRRLLIIQALMYFFAFLITWVFVAVRMVNLTNGNISSLSATNVLQRIFFPLQGFFNAIIFLHHKVTNLRQCHGSSISLSKALYYIILQPKMKMSEMHLSGVSIVERDRQKQEKDKNRIREQQQQVGNSPDNNDNNNDNSKNTSSPDDDNRNDRISFSEEISYMFDDAGVWVYTESIEENENDENRASEVCKDEENLYDTLSSANLSHDMSFMNASFLAVSHVSEISSIKSKDKEQSDTRNELKGKEGQEEQEIGDAVSKRNSSKVTFMRSALTEDDFRK